MRAVPKKIPALQVDYQLVPLPWRHWLLTATLFSVIAALLILWLIPNSLAISDLLFLPQSAQKNDGVRNFLIARSEKTQDADIIILGTSAAREALVHEQELSDRMLDRCGMQLRFVELTSESQTILEHLFLVKQISLSKEQLVVLTISPAVFYRSPAVSERRLLNGLFPLAEIHRLQPLTEVLPEIQPWFGTRTQSNLVRNTIYQRVHYGLQSWAETTIYDYSPEYQKYRYSEFPAGDLRVIEKSRLARRQAFEEAFEENRDFNFRALQLLVDEIELAGASVVFVEQPRIHGESVFAPWQRQYDSMIRMIVAARNASYFNLNERIELGPECFYDVAHVSSSGRNDWSEEFILWLDTYLNENSDLAYVK